MAAVSSLLKSAQATQKRILKQEEAEIAFEWAQSAKTYDQFLEYSKYLDNNASKSSDPSEVLSYRKAIDSARQGYVSNEIQRQTINVMEGRATNSDKYSTMVGLYRQAVENGDYDLAQSLNSQLDSLSIQIQNEFESAQRVAGTMAMNGVKSLNKLVKKIESGDELVELPDGTVIKPISMLNQELSQAGNSEADYFGEILRTATALQNVVADAYLGATTQDAVDAIEAKYSGVLDGTKDFKTAAGNLNLQEMDTAYRSALANNPIYSVSTTRDPNTGETAYKLSKNKIDDFVWTYNDDGTVSATEVTAKVPDPFQTLSAKTNDDGSINTDPKAEGSTVEQRLADLGYFAEKNDDGTIKVTTPEGEIFDRAAIMPDGTIRYFGEPGQFSGGQAGLYEVNLKDGGRREVSADETSMFGVESKFGGLISKPTDQGVRITEALAGVTKQSRDKLSGALPIAVGLDTSGRALPVSGANLQGATQVLQGASATAAVLSAQEAARNSAVNMLQNAQVFNLNQTPVQQFAQSGAPVKQLSVSKPKPLPSISVAKPTPTPAVVVQPLMTPQGQNLQGGGGTGATAVPRVLRPWEVGR